MALIISVAAALAQRDRCLSFKLRIFKFICQCVTPTAIHLLINCGLGKGDRSLTLRSVTILEKTKVGYSEEKYLIDY